GSLTIGPHPSSSSPSGSGGVMVSRPPTLSSSFSDGSGETFPLVQACFDICKWFISQKGSTACILRGAPECLSWNSFLLSSRIFSSGSKVQSALSGYPFHFTKYLIFPQTTFESINSSTSYSSSPSTMIGGGGSGFFWEGKVAGGK